jgi:hypothetical protein
MLSASTFALPLHKNLRNPMSCFIVPKDPSACMLLFILRISFYTFTFEGAITAIFACINRFLAQKSVFASFLYYIANDKFSLVMTDVIISFCMVFHIFHKTNVIFIFLGFGLFVNLTV